MKYEVKKWNNEVFGEMTFENICRIYSANKNLTLVEKPPLLRSMNVENEDKKYCVRWNRYESGVNFTGESYIASDYYVLKGICEIKIDEEIIKMQTEDYFEFPESKYSFRVIGDDYFEYVAVYKLPTDVSFPI